MRYTLAPFLKRVVSAFVNDYSVLFGGTDEFCGGGDVLSIDRTDAFTVSAWLKASATGVNHVIMSKVEGGPNLGYQFWYTSASRAGLWFFDAAGSLSVSINVSVPLAWNHVVFTGDGTGTAAGVKIYINGVLGGNTVGTDTLSSTLINTRQFELGGGGGVGFSPWQGNQDEVSMWTTDLNQTEIDEIYNGGEPNNLLAHSAAASLRAWWRMGDGDTFPTLLDQTANNYDVTMTNMESGDIETDVP